MSYKMKMMLLSVLAIFALGIYSCKKDNGSNSQYATVKMHLADGPATLYDAVYLDVKEVNVQWDNGTWTTINVIRPGVYDLLKFRNGIDTLIASVDIPAGHISQIRLILGSNNSVVVGGVSYPLNTPSAQESGIKLNLDQTLVAGISYDIWIDFDAGSSVHQNGSGTYMLKPVIRAYGTATNGEIKGYVFPLTALVTVYATSGLDTFAALPDTTGYFLFTGLPAGTYTLTFDASVISFTDLVMNNVKVQYGIVTDVGITTLH